MLLLFELFIVRAEVFTGIQCPAVITSTKDYNVARNYKFKKKNRPIITTSRNIQTGKHHFKLSTLQHLLSTDSQGLNLALEQSCPQKRLSFSSQNLLLSVTEVPALLQATLGLIPNARVARSRAWAWELAAASVSQNEAWSAASWKVWRQTI